MLVSVCCSFVGRRPFLTHYFPLSNHCASAIFHSRSPLTISSPIRSDSHRYYRAGEVDIAGELAEHGDLVGAGSFRAAYEEVAATAAPGISARSGKLDGRTLLTRFDKCYRRSVNTGWKGGKAQRNLAAVT